MVSCHPAALARDLAALTAAGFSVTDTVAVDMFPQTPHLEAVARLVPRAEP
jgi:23S rRNA (uracil1939-C5)-methyltransferase